MSLHFRVIAFAIVLSVSRVEDSAAQLRFLSPPANFEPVNSELVGETSHREFDSGFDIDDEADASPAAIYFATRGNSGRPARQMRPEFLRQTALMVSARLTESAPEVLKELGKATNGRVPLVVLVNDQLELADSELLLEGNEGNRNHFLFLSHDTIWARDYGPTVIAEGARTVVVDAKYSEPDRTEDNGVPAAIASVAHVRSRQTSLCIPGGNLLTNGKGICITTTQVQVENPTRSQGDIAEAIVDAYGAKVVAILEPLAGEPTGHVDMFATFTDERTVVVGKYVHHIDPENAAILNRNAKMLASLRVGNEKLRVVRLPMPPRESGEWPTFTNVVYANGKLLVPIYGSTTPKQRAYVEKFYLSLLPKWQVHFIPADNLICSGGALHCVVSNLGTIPIPENRFHRQYSAAGWQEMAGRLVRSRLSEFMPGLTFTER